MINAEREKMRKCKTISYLHNHVNNFIADLVLFLDIGIVFNSVCKKKPAFDFGEGIM